MEGKSIEDLILERYANELSADHSMSKRVERSPYQLPLGHSNILSSYKTQQGSCSSIRSHRTRSTKPVSERSRSTDIGRAPPHTPTKESEASLRQAPIPANRRNSGSSGHFMAKGLEKDELDLTPLQNSQDLNSTKDESARHSRLSTGRKKTKTRASYLLKPAVYVVNAFKNGDTSTSHRVSAPNFERLLEECTQRLHLPSSARKLFLSSGAEVTKDSILPRGIDVFASMGEPFKDPLKMFEKKLSIKADMQWTLTGLNLPSGREKETTKPLIGSTRLEGNRAAKRRILAFPNGKGIKGVEVMADMTNMEDFLQSCTFKLKSGQPFRRVLLLDGQEVTNLHTVPMLHHFFNSSSAPLLGPVWLSKGENISPMGVEEYLRDSIEFVARLKSQCNKYLAQLNAAYYCDNRSSIAGDPQLTDKRILSLSKKELEQNIAKETENHDEYVAFLTEFKAKVRAVEPKARSELEEGSQFTMKHISALPENHRLVSDRRGIRLKVHNNGRDSDPVTVYFNMREASRGLGKDRDGTRIVFQRFLDSLSANPQLAGQSSKSKGTLVQRIFTKSGQEVTDALTLQYDDEIWISHGENWIDPFTYCLQAEVSRITAWKKGAARFAVRSDIPHIDDSLERPSAWDAQWQLPDDVEQLTLEEDEEEEAEEEYVCDFEDEDGEEIAAAAPGATKEPIKPPEGSVPIESCFLQHSRNRKLCLFVEPVVGVMKVPHESAIAKSDDHQQTRPVLPVWPKAGIAQSWVIHKSGQISVKGFPGLALAVTDYEIETDLNGVRIRGSLVQFCPFERDEFQVRASQRWIFHTDGLVYSKQFPELALTYLGGSIDELSSCPKNELDRDSGHRNLLAVCEHLESRLAKYQRFGIRLQKLGNLSQLRKAARYRDPAWSKLAIVWPTDQRGHWIEDYDWPIEGQILTFAPPLKYKPEAEQRKRLFCLKNGERKEEVGVFITAPDLTNMKKDRQLLKRQTTKTRRIRHSSLLSDAASTVTADEFQPGETEQKVSEVQFQIFLESCTTKLGLNAEAKRLFDRNGFEHKSLKQLESDQVVYISTGEDWIDPKFTKSQLEARSLLSKLSDDVDKIRCFVALRKSTQNLALSTESLTPSARICVVKDASVASVDDSNYAAAGRLGNGVRDSEDGKLNKLRWPWERIVSPSLMMALPGVAASAVEMAMR
ncbi:hypothetical protein BOX15_Mlig027318g1 [Macrostomum lignano]|uniref:Doublecortin domain-containing protein n=1 Tax=Macrostomum lignano TaxID=282301 RepID=A0A267GK56_9PLAT|nr:hypothetical protein BOX15_Mlig027318g1 [Macrostomum lignano]